MLGLAWMYNDLGGADYHYVMRNFINAWGFVCYSAGSAKVAAGFGEFELSHHAGPWLAIIWAIVFNTLQVQDMADVDGDAARGRRTMPLVCGRLISRLSIAVAVLAFSFLCPWYWSAGAVGYIPTLSTGTVIVYRTLSYRDRESDRGTFKLWCAWMTLIYALPAIEDHIIFEPLRQL